MPSVFKVLFFADKAKLFLYFLMFLPQLGIIHGQYYGGLNVLEVQMGVRVATELPAQHPKTTKAG